MRLLRWIGRVLVAAIALLAGRRRAAEERTVPPPPSETSRAARTVTALLAAAGLGFAGFGAGYLLDLGNTFLGGTLALAFGLLAAALIVASQQLVPQEEATEEVGEHAHHEERARAAATIAEGAEGLTRRRLLVAAGGTGCVAAASLALPVASLGPVLDTERLRASPWRPGRLLVDTHGAPIDADAIEVGSFVTAFADGADPKALDASLIICRVRPDELRLPPERSGWAPEGLLAYSKICTHAACAISLFDYPSFQPTTPEPRLVCPCHYSVFDATGGGDVVSGPAGRPLPQLPLRINDDRTLAAAGELSAPPGPSWSGVRG